MITFCTYTNLCTFLYFMSKFGRDFPLRNIIQISTNNITPSTNQSIFSSDLNGAVQIHIPVDDLLLVIPNISTLQRECRGYTGCSPVLDGSERRCRDAVPVSTPGGSLRSAPQIALVTGCCFSYIPPQTTSLLLITQDMLQLQHLLQFNNKLHCRK